MLYPYSCGSTSLLTVIPTLVRMTLALTEVSQGDKQFSKWFTWTTLYLVQPLQYWHWYIECDSNNSKCSYPCEHPNEAFSAVSISLRWVRYLCWISWIGWYQVISDFPYFKFKVIFKKTMTPMTGYPCLRNISMWCNPQVSTGITQDLWLWSLLEIPFRTGQCGNLMSHSLQMDMLLWATIKG